MSNKITKIVSVLCVLAVIGEFIVHKHPAHFKVEEIPGFYGLYGFVAFIVIVLVAKYFVRPVVMREEDYYDE